MDALSVVGFGWVVMNKDDSRMLSLNEGIKSVLQDIILRKHFVSFYFTINFSSDYSNLDGKVENAYRCAVV